MGRALLILNSKECVSQVVLSKIVGHDISAFSATVKFCDKIERCNVQQYEHVTSSKKTFFLRQESSHIRLAVWLLYNLVRLRLIIFFNNSGLYYDP